MKRTLAKTVARKMPEGAADPLEVALGTNGQRRSPPSKQRLPGLEQSEGKVRGWALQLARSEEKERHRLALLVRDDLQQTLYGANLCVEVLRSHAKDKETHKILGQISEYIKKGIETGRALSIELSPPIIYDAGLAHALIWLSLWMEDKYGLKVQVQCEEQAEPGNQEVRVHLFLAVRELLFYLVQACGISHAQLQVTRRDDAEVQILVQSAGKAPARRARRMSEVAESEFGLSRARARMVLVRGRLTVRTRAQSGSRFLLRAPIGKKF